MNVMNEEQIIRLIKNGEPEAYRQLVERYQTGVIIYCENILKDRHAGEDIAQEAFVKAYYSISKFDPNKATFSTWLYKIATNLAKDYLRKRKVNIDLSVVEDFIGENEGLSAIEKSEIRQKVRELQPPEYSAVIQAYFWNGMGYEEIAKDMDVPIGTISTWMNRAKQLLRKELA